MAGTVTVASESIQIREQFSLDIPLSLGKAIDTHRACGDPDSCRFR